MERIEAIAGTRFAPEPVRKALEANLGKLAGYTWFRCAGHEYRLAAGGHVDVLCYHRLMPWDHAPGWLLHREAGVFSTHFDGSPFDPGRMAWGLLYACDRDCRHEARASLLIPAAGPRGRQREAQLPVRRSRRRRRP